MASIIIDSHVHLYPVFSIENALQSSIQNFMSLEKNIPDSEKGALCRIWLLTERSDMHVFQTLLDLDSSTFSAGPGRNNECVYIYDNDTCVLTVFPGRQLITADRLEICALGCKIDLPDAHLSTRETILTVQNEGGIAAVNWAPGKWFGKRGKIVAALFDHFSPSELLISDTTMRPAVWPTPRLIKKARKQGFQMLCGSDPLPFKGEEKWLGTYCTVTRGTWNDENPKQSLRKLLLHPDFPLKTYGTRSGLWSFTKRQYKIMKKNK
ncbi:MAG: hypothetical protein U5R06_00595 [candidate division KSB1 bacterium]|nr:hypothetical protein [candidate division KSB1 bacterium]